MKRASRNGFDLLAPVYDLLARLIFGRSIIRSQTCFLADVPHSSKVLILGGGTGWLLSGLLGLKPDCEVWYVELSGRMLALARRRNIAGNIHFIHGTLASVPVVRFDVVITHFFLDLFSVPALPTMVQEIVSLSKPTALWLAADFVDRGKWWQRFLLRAMYLFFKWTCRIDADKLPDWDRTLQDAGLKKIVARRFYRGFIESSVYSRN